MAILSRDDFLNRLEARIGDDTSDEAMSFLEDMTDTFNDMESRATGVNEAEWQQKYDDLDKTWREKYKARFFETGTSPAEVMTEQTENVVADGEERTFEDLFVEREG